ncbi:MAG: hypothetical protein K2Q26_02435 [Bdellovibrionales bacterium]|nr:hypothetical protein [Bdellovibrionales bacterium]
MEDLAPSYNFVLHLQTELSSGVSVRTLIDQYLKEAEVNSFTLRLTFWLQQHSHCTYPQFCLKNGTMSAHQRVLFDLLYQSVQGKSIFEPIQSLEQEMREASISELDAHLGKLPYKLMIPLLLLQFPALLLIILGPLIFHFLTEVSQ